MKWKEKRIINTYRKQKTIYSSNNSWLHGSDKDKSLKVAILSLGNLMKLFFTFMFSRLYYFYFLFTQLEVHVLDKWSTLQVIRPLIAKEN